MHGTIQIVKSLKESGLLIKYVSKTIKNERKEQSCEFLSISLGTLGASLLGNLLTSKNMKAKIPQRRVIRAAEGTITVDQDF